jgi:transcriptional regulator with XRE-family HTH domain
MKPFSAKVRDARNELGLTQTQLGEIVGVSLRTILGYEKDEKRPRQRTMLKLAQALKVSVKFLSDDDCEDPMAEIEKDNYIAQARASYGAEGARDINRMLDENRALFAGGELSQDQKDAYFNALLTAYTTCRQVASAKFSKKKSE